MKPAISKYQIARELLRTGTPVRDVVLMWCEQVDANTGTVDYLKAVASSFRSLWRLSREMGHKETEQLWFRLGRTFTVAYRALTGSNT